MTCRPVGSTGKVGGKMTDQERDELLLTIAATQREHGEKLDRILTIAQGQAAARVTSDERLAVLERRVADLERKAV